MLTDARAKSGHVIVCGLEGVALRTIEQLQRSGVPVVVLAEGHVLAEGTMAALRKREEVVEAYLVG